MCNRRRWSLRAPLVKYWHVYCMNLEVATTMHHPRTIRTGV
jgi:hypothetical protein